MSTNDIYLVQTMQNIIILVMISQNIAASYTKD